jgi:hypothetical protein
VSELTVFNCELPNPPKASRTLPQMALAKAAFLHNVRLIPIERSEFRRMLNIPTVRMVLCATQNTITVLDRKK